MPSPDKAGFNPAKVPPIPCDFKVGDTVTFTNDYGIEFPGLKVVGFTDELEPDRYGRFIYLNTSCWWFPKRPENLRKEVKNEVRA